MFLAGGNPQIVLYDLVASLRPKPARPLVRFEGLPGEFSQHAFGEVERERGRHRTFNLTD
jgi:hypothetical protein